MWVKQSPSPPTPPPPTTTHTPPTPYLPPHTTNPTLTHTPIRDHPRETKDEGGWSRIGVCISPVFSRGWWCVADSDLTPLITPFLNTFLAKIFRLFFTNESPFFHSVYRLNLIKKVNVLSIRIALHPLLYQSLLQFETHLQAHGEELLSKK